MSIGSRVTELERENAELRRAISLLHRIANLVRQSLELRPTCYAVLTGVTAGVGLGMNRAMLFLVDTERRDVLRGIAAVGPTDGAEADRVWKSIEEEAPDLETLYRAGLHLSDAPGPLDRRVRASEVTIDGESPVAIALRRGTTVAGEGTDSLSGLLHLPTGIAAPMRGREAVQGVLFADNCFTGETPTAIAEQVFTMVADHAGRAIENARRYEQLARQARTDALTGLGHHGALMGALRIAVARARASSAPLAVAMVDLDDFKKVNDTHGHLAGDALLVGVAARMRAELRASQSVYRYGGEEFTVILPDAGADEATTVAERLRRAVSEQPITVADGLSLAVTASLGVSALGAGDDHQALLARADSALLAAKARGKNVVVRADQLSAK